MLTGARRHLDHPSGPDDDPIERLVRYTASALSVGARALAVVESSLDLAALDRSIAGLSDKVETSTRQALDALATAVTAATDPTQGAIPRSVETTLTGMVEQVTALVAGRDAPVSTAVTEAVRAVTDQTLGEVQRAIAAQADTVRRVLATDAPGSPLHDLKKGLVEGLNESHRRLAGQLTDLRTALEVDRAHAAAATRAPRHGLDSEASTLAALGQLAHTAGDELEPTGTTPGAIPRCLKGDATITLAPPPGHTAAPVRVVVEVKDRERAQSLKSWRSLLEESRENRQAVAALGIVKTVDQMPGQRRLHLLDSTTYLLAYDAATDDQDLLLAAYHLLRSHAWESVLGRHSGEELDLSALRTANAELGNALSAFDVLTRHHNAARRSIDQADQAANALRADLQSRVETTRQLLNGSGAAGNPAA